MPDYTVTFQADGATVKTMTVEDGYVLKDSDYPAVPTKTGYTGEWVKYTSAVHSNVTVQAKYTAVVAKYTVTFKADNTVVKTMTVKDGYTLKASDYPTVPAKSGYKGSWKRYTAAIHSDITIDAVYEPVIVTKQYTVVFRADAKVLKTMKVEGGYTLQDSDYPEIPAKEGYTGHWDKSTTRIIKNTIINVIYSDNSSHVVTFIFDGVQIGTLTVTDGYVLKNSDYPSPFAPVGYIVTWEKYTLPIHSDITVTGKLQSDVTIPPQPTDPGEIMSGGEGEPVEADEPEENGAEPYSAGAMDEADTITHDYLTQSGKVARETIRQSVGGTVLSTKTLDFFYDESGRPFAFNYSVDGGIASTYYYILNLQGDVVQIIDANGVMQAEYVYSPWGEIISAEGDLAEINPLRYRGYYYDSETGFYYLQSRYYDPENHRFINADSYASTGQGFLGVNMFAYANNNPIIFGDAAGTVVDVVIAQYTETIPLEGATIHVTTEIVARYEIFDGTISLDDTSVSYSHDIYRDASGAVFTPLVNYNGEEPWYGLECTVADTTFSIDCNSIFSMSPREIHLYDNLYAKVRAEIEFDDTDPRGFSGVPVPAVYPESISSALATGFALGSAMMYYGTAGGGLPSASRPRSYLCDR